MQLSALRTLEDALKLLQRFDKGQGFQRYVKSRLHLIVPVGLLVLLTGIAFASATIVLAGPYIWLALPAMVLAPIILLGTVFVQAYVFFCWLENRAMAQALGRAAGRPGPVGLWALKNLRIDLGTPPPVPWDLAAIFVLVPLAILWAVSWKIALALAVVHALTPLIYARLDR